MQGYAYGMQDSSGDATRFQGRGMAKAYKDGSMYARNVSQLTLSDADIIRPAFQPRIARCEHRQQISVIEDQVKLRHQFRLTLTGPET